MKNLFVHLNGYLRPVHTGERESERDQRKNYKHQTSFLLLLLLSLGVNGCQYFF